MNQNLQCTRCGGSGHLAKDCGMPVVGAQPEALRIATEFESFNIDHEPDGWPAIQQRQLNDASIELRHQHAAIERKDALLRQALDALENHAGNYKLSNAEGTIVSAVVDAITKELQ